VAKTILAVKTHNFGDKVCGVLSHWAAWLHRMARYGFALRHVEFVVEKLALVKAFFAVSLLWLSNVNSYIP